MYKKEDFKILKSNIVYDHYVRVRQDIISAPNNSIVDYNYVDSDRNAVIVLPVYRDKIIMLKQYRYPLKKYVFDLPGGGINKGDNSLITAEKELKEETGFEAKTFKYINSFYHIPAYSTILVDEDVTNFKIS